MAGYSATPLGKKLGITDTSAVACIGSAPPGVEFSFAALDEAPFDVVLAFVADEATFAAHVARWGELLVANGGLWICWPKKTARKKPQFADADMTEDIVRLHALPLGLVDNKVCAIDDDWSGLRLVWRVENRAGRPIRRSSR
jgi:hypothetical protein